MNGIVLKIVCYFAILAGVAFRAECVCNKACTLDYTPVCGSDGKTYGNKCALEAAACEFKTDITVAHDGECKKACFPACPFIHRPVCGSDEVTYGSECELKVAACQTGKTITVAHDGDC